MSLTFKQIKRLLDSKRGRDILLLLFLAILAIVPRAFHLSAAPPGLDGDELFNAIDALRVGPGNWLVYFEGNNGREALFLYLIAISLNLFGETVWALRLPAALLGVGSVLLTFMIGRTEFNRRVGLLGAAIMAVSLWPIMQSRWGLRAVSLTFFTSLTVYLFSQAFRRNERATLPWLAAGAALGLTMYTYIPSRLFPLVILIWFAWFALNNRDSFPSYWRIHRRDIVLSFFVALLLFAPFGLYMVQNPESVNQRVSGLETSIEKAQSGEPAAILESISNVLLMFTFRGDPQARYHFDARPVFDPLLGLFFYIGLATCIWLAFRHENRRRRSSYVLLPLWMGGMLAPNLILGVGTSFLRGSGAIVPIYLTAALGVDRVYRWLVARWPARQRSWQILFTGMATVGLLLIFVDSWQSYFNVWVNNPKVRLTYEAELGEIGRYLAENPVPDDTEIFTGYEFVLDYAPQALAFFSRQPVTWFDYSKSFAWRPDGNSAWYLSTISRPYNDEAVKIMSPNGRAEVVNYDNGDAAFSIFKIDPDQVKGTPQHPVDIRFENAPWLVGIDLPAFFFRGETVRLNTHWLIPESLSPQPNRFTFIEVQLQDESGNNWVSDDSLLGYPQAGWKAGDRFTQAFDLKIPEGIPPGPVYLKFGLRDFEDEPYAFASDFDQRAGPFLVRSQPRLNLAISDETPLFDDTLALTGHAFSSQVMPGMPINISLDWLAVRRPVIDYQIQLRLVETETNLPIYSQTFKLWPNTYPPTQWQQGEAVTTFHRLHVPVDLPEVADTELSIQLLSPDQSTPLPQTQGSHTLAQMTVIQREHMFERPAISQSFEAQLGDSIQLLGYDLDNKNMRSGGELELTLYWLALDTPVKAYTVFNHLVDADGQIVTQFDGPPVGDAWLTTTWLPGEIVVDQRKISIPQNIAEGSYSLIIGIYDSKDGQRLPITSNSESQLNDQLELDKLIIRP
jgi:4-amino-4-deoxy-L-arabinose transferase-like glycosyltransferase